MKHIWWCDNRLVTLLIVAVLILVTACQQAPTSTPSQTPTSSPTPTTTPTQTVTPTPTPTIAPAPIITPPPALVKSSNLNSTTYVVFAWNDLGMHCLNPTFDTAVILPPYNNLWTQVIKRGNPPQIVTSGLTVEYKILNNTYSYGKGTYSQFWDNVKKLFGIDLAKNTGLNLVDPSIHNGLSGNMVAKSDHFEADGIPLTPIYDSGGWNPFQIYDVTVKDSSGTVVAHTYATAPISDEMDCAKCHGANALQDVLQKHDQHNNTNLVNQEPVLCASCHGDPALGAPKTSQTLYLSDAMHGFHSTVSPQPACYDCHPGAVTQCARSLAHTAPDGNCITCHGTLAQVSSSVDTGSRIPWANEPKCVSCHTGVAGVDTQTTLYRNDTGHGGVYCASCHSSPHAMVPTNVLSDNFQALQYEGKAKTIGACESCHQTSRGGGEISDFTETHGGLNPQRPNACNICHTSVSSDTSQWPHAFQWKTRQ